MGVIDIHRFWKVDVKPPEDQYESLTVPAFTLNAVLSPVADTRGATDPLPVFAIPPSE
jgi:hypothetical protein